MKKVIIKMAKKLLRLEHTIYCMTGCRVELPLHKAYYEMCRRKFEEAKDLERTARFQYK